ncbi:MAG: deoxyribonuclease V [bacterium]
MDTTHSGSTAPLQWAQTIAEAREIQRALLHKVKIKPLKKEPKGIAAVDAAFTGNKVVAAACLFTFPDMIFIEESFAVRDILFPYVPGYLSFREGPAVVDALQKLKRWPDLIIFDGQGIAHPRGLGIASHIGVLLDAATIGCAKSRLVGDFKMPKKRKGSYEPLVYQGRTVGFVLRTREGVKPVFVSPGHNIDFADSLRIVLSCTGIYRIPEPLRQADALSRTLKREGGDRDDPWRGKGSSLRETKRII